MKKILYSVISAILLFLGSACEKDKTEYKATANINVINATIGTGSVKVNPGAGSGFSYAAATSLPAYANSMYGAFVGNNTVTVVSATDTTKTLFQRSISLQPISTLYLSGQSPALDTMFRVEQNLPYIASAVANPDNSVYIRFVNLSPNSPPLSINIKSTTTVPNEVNALPYQGISPFKKYDALTTTPNYVFEIRNAATNVVLFTTPTYNVANIRYKTISIVIKGLVGLVAPFPAGTSAADQIGVFQVNYI